MTAVSTILASSDGWPEAVETIAVLAFFGFVAWLIFR